MPSVQIDRIVSVSSEHAEHPASNIFSEDNGHWTCNSRGEKQLSVIVQLKTSTKVTSVHVGNYGSAFVEVLVGKATSTLDNDFKVLLPCSSLMSLQESRAEKNMQTVKMFATDKLNAEVQAQYWDRVKVVCTQPYNNHLYGLTFVKLMGDTQEVSSTLEPRTSSKNNPLANLTVPELSTDPNPDTIKIGSFFKNRSSSASMSVTKTAGSATGRQPDVQNTPNKPTLASQLRNPSTSSGDDGKVSIDVSPKEPPRKIAKIEKTPSQTSSSKKIFKTESKSEKDKPNSNSNHGNGISAEKNKKEDVKFAPFEKLFEGVVFCLSGFVNPTRGDLRQKAMQMGAKFKQDWSSDCTHLICAFSNTPKFNQVKSGFPDARIVKKEWIEDCHSRKCKLNIANYSMIPVSSKVKEEPEVHLEVEKATKISPSTATADSSLEPKTVNGNVATTLADTTSVYDAETDSEYEYEDDVNNEAAKPDEQQSDSKPNGELPPLPDFFKRRKFFLFGEFSEDQRRHLKRLIIAYNGVLCPYMDENINYIVTNNSWSSDFDDVLEENSSVQFIKPSWLFACDKQQKAVPIQYHIVPPS